VPLKFNVWDRCEPVSHFVCSAVVEHVERLPVSTPQRGIPNGLMSTGAILDQTPEIASQSCGAILRIRASLRNQPAMKNRPCPGRMVNKTGPDRVPERRFNMLKNINSSPCPTDNPLLAPTKAENYIYNIPVKLVDRKSSWRDEIGLRAPPAPDADDDQSEARDVCDETHCASAVIEPIFGLINLRPNHCAGRETNRELPSDYVSRSRDWTPEDKTFGDRTTPHGKADEDRTRHTVSWKRPTPHVITSARFETSCVE